MGGVLWLEQADQLVWTWLGRTSEARKSKTQQGAEATSLSSLGSACS